jgi:hypothetical protein
MKRIAPLLFFVGLLMGCDMMPDFSARREVSTTGYTVTTPQGELSNTITTAKYKGQIFLLLLVKNTNGSGGSSSGSRISGQFFSPKGAEVLHWSCDSPDGETGSIAIASETFDLAKGGLLLVDPWGRKIVTQQVSVDLSQFQTGDVVERLKTIALTNPKVAAFLEDFAPPPNTTP